MDFLRPVAGFALLHLLRPVLLPAFVLCSFLSMGTPVPYRLHVHDGLPSNHVYHLLVDRNGYLWMATQQGVVKYNGYDLKIFDLSSRLPGNDVWGLHEDNKGRLWLSCICPSIGYIYNNEFKTVVIKDPPPRLHPLFWNYRGGIFLYSQYNQNLVYDKMYIERNDTMYGYRSKAIGYAYYDPEKNELFTVRHPRLTVKDSWDYVYVKKAAPGGVITRLHYRISKQITTDRLIQFFDKYALFFRPGGNDILTLDLVDTTWNIIYLDEDTGGIKGKIFSQNKNTLYLATGNALYLFNDSLRRIGKYRIEAPVPPKSISTVLYDSLWGICTGTLGNGVYISHGDEWRFVPVRSQLSGYRYMGNSSNGDHYWWDRISGKMVCIDSNGRTENHFYRDLATIIKIVPWNREKSLLLHYNMLYQMDHRTGTLAPFLRDKRVVSGLAFLQEYEGGYIRNLDIAVVDTGRFFLLCRSGLYHFNQDRGKWHAAMIGDSAKTDKGEAYTSIIYDPLQKMLWAYNDNAVMRYDGDGGYKVVRSNIQNEYGIRNIEKILIDHKYGNIFLKEFDRLVAFNVFTRQFRLLHKNINLEKSLAYLYEDMLIVTGRFGIAFVRIAGPDKYSSAILHENVRNRQYNDILDVQVSGKEVVLNTDKGLLSVAVPDSLDFARRGADGSRLPFRFLLGYSGNVQRIRSGDTIRLDQKNLWLQFDLIRPSGNGVLKYEYQLAGIDEKWKPLNGNELLLPGLAPGQTCMLSVKVSDHVWRSDRLDFQLYVVPYWWQTLAAKRIIWSAVVLAVIFLVWIIVWITKRIVVRNNIKRNLNMEMELKSIYSQINPHFIFNTLNSALLLIETRKIQDAHRHVYQFSKLLRAYMKSSRNRFITVAEEVENLKNYIELQQIRFKGKFDYEIVPDQSVEIGHVRIPSLLLQPIVENAISHGLFHKKGKGFLSIRFKRGTGNHEIICTIEDDGVGRRLSKEIRRGSSLKSESYGDRLIEDLMRIFNKYEGMDIRIEYQDKESPFTGTLVTLHIKKAI